MGFSYEHRFVERMLKQGAKKAYRHYGSRGIMDVEWTDQFGFKNEAQLKFSSKKQPKVSQKELARIKEYASKKVGVKIWTICKMSRGDEIWEAMN
jgi:hypothetical protein